MRQVQIFSGTSHPELVESMCSWLGLAPGKADLGKFSNGETSVQMQTSIRNQDVFIVQSGSNKINDSVVELLIMCSACKGGSSKSITAVMPYFPYSRQSKKKQHRGAITARMIANLLHIAGVNHVITIDLHSSQMQGFFKCPVDNLVAEPLLANWIRRNVADWKQGVVVSKNPGGTRRVTSLADALELDFAIVTTDRRRPTSYNASLDGNHSMVFDKLEVAREQQSTEEDDEDDERPKEEQEEEKAEIATEDHVTTNNETDRNPLSPKNHLHKRRTASNDLRRRAQTPREVPSSPLAKSTRLGESPNIPGTPITRARTAPATGHDLESEFTDERARDVITGRIRHGHLVDEDDFPSPAYSTISGSRYRSQDNDDGHQNDPMMQSFMSTVSSMRYELSGEQHALGGSIDAAASSEEEEEGLMNPDLETTVTLVGNVRDRPVFIVDDMLDKAGSWIAAAETVVKRGGATKVYCMATHGMFGGDSLRELDECECIDRVVVTNSFPIPVEKKRTSRKLEEISVAPMLSEAIRRFHHGESMGNMYSAMD